MLHLDGLLDVADAVLAARSPEARRKILADVHLGSFAFGVGFVHLLLKWQAIAASPALSLLLAPVAARFWLLPVMRYFPAAKKEGLGARARPGRWFWGAVFALPVFFLAPLPFLLTGLLTALLAGFVSRRLAGLNGDAYGALIEAAELLFLLAAALVP
jgi:adenosylcobinamide-GDP ribazoletransferase